jgi:hypothetical protein
MTLMKVNRSSLLVLVATALIAAVIPAAATPIADSAQQASQQQQRNNRTRTRWFEVPDGHKNGIDLQLSYRRMKDGTFHVMYKIRSRYHDPVTGRIRLTHPSHGSTSSANASFRLRFKQEYRDGGMYFYTDRISKIRTRVLDLKW